MGLRSVPSEQRLGKIKNQTVQFQLGSCQIFNFEIPNVGQKAGNTSTCRGRYVLLECFLLGCDWFHDDICMCVVNKQFELLEFVLIPCMLTCSTMRFLSFLLMGLCVCVMSVVVLGLSVRLSWYPIYEYEFLLF